MATLLLGVASFRVQHTQAMSHSDPQQAQQGGQFHRRYRDDRSLRTWSLSLRAGRGHRLWAEHQFNQGASGSGQWDWTPPREATLVKVRFVVLAWATANTASGPLEATVVEDRSSDT